MNSYPKSNIKYEVYKYYAKLKKMLLNSQEPMDNLQQYCWENQNDWQNMDKNMNRWQENHKLVNEEQNKVNIYIHHLK